MAGGNCPETPRQKMIGMMYLFYTALLALNVSGEVINAFVKIDDSIKKTTESFSEKTRSLYATIDAKEAEQRGKYTALAKQAHNIEASSNELFNYIDELKLTIIKKVEGEEATLNTVINKKDDLNAANEILIGGGKGNELRKKVEDYRSILLDVIQDTSNSIYKQINKTLSTDDQLDGENKLFWQESFSQAMPLIGTLALLSKLQADVRNSEADLLGFMIAKLEGLDIRISALEGLVNSTKSFIIRGGQYKSSVFLGARDTTMRPTIYLTYSRPFYDSTINAEGVVEYKLRQGITYDTLPVDASGKGHHTHSCGSVGDFSYGGLIYYKSNKGDMWLPYSSEYQVGEAGFTISATKCNVFYKGLENPVEVSVSGYPKENISVNITGGASIRAAGNAGYIVTVPQSVTSKEVSISVSVRTDEGVRSLGTKTFNVLNVPPPTILVSNYKDGAQVPKAAITRNPKLSARLESDFFPFEGINYSIAKYDFIYTVRGVARSVSVTGDAFNSEVLSEVQKMGAGSQLTFSNIFYNGPSGTRQTNGITVIIK